MSDDVERVVGIPTWTPLIERQPEIGQLVAVQYGHDSDVWDAYRWDGDRDVYAWLPLPEPGSASNVSRPPNDGLREALQGGADPAGDTVVALLSDAAQVLEGAGGGPLADRLKAVAWKLDGILNDTDETPVVDVPAEEPSYGVQRLVAWLEQKHKRHGEECDRQAAAMILHLCGLLRDAQPYVEGDGQTTTSERISLAERIQRQVRP